MHRNVFHIQTFTAENIDVYSQIILSLRDRHIKSLTDLPTDTVTVDFEMAIVAVLAT